MNILRVASAQAFQAQRFATPDKAPSSHRIITIAVAETGSVSHKSEEVSAKQVRDFVRAPVPAGSVSLFRLVSFDCDNGAIMAVTRDMFSDVWSAFGIDEYCKFLFCKRAVCFHLPQRRRPGSLQSVYLGLKSCRIIYTFDVATRVTGAILVQDRNDDPTTNPLINLPIQIVQAANLAVHPCFLPVVGLLALVLFVRGAQLQVLSGIVLYGRSLGLNIWTTNVLSHDLTTAEQLVKLGNMMDLMEPVLGELDYIRRYITIVYQVLEGLSSDQVQSLVSSVEHPFVKAATDEVEEVVEIARGQIAAENNIMTYWLERTKNQMTTVFNMVNRGDVVASVQLARSASKDSSSMKIIAVMTMVFLPATFFAALFAVPSLRWEEDSVVSDKFWVYWAFTLPTTALVFVVWFVIVKRKAVKAWLRRRLEWATSMLGE